MNRAAPDPPTLGEATRVWARIALLSFGGPAGQIAVVGSPGTELEFAL